ncbi:MAG: polysaccharide biosynthesis/export family protein [Bacteroidia bacterium]|jgi:polysaccharide export outer membrane protein|nr:polysaccharide biosynthesis/export family protein [Bacteroidia bacterium]
MKNRNGFFWVLIALMGMNSCKLFYPNQMFKQKDYQYFEFAHKKMEEYLIEPGDQLSLQVYSRDGFKLIDVLGGGVSGGSTNSGTQSSSATGMSSTNVSNTTNTNQVTYLVDNEGFAKLPILGDYYVKGYSHLQLEKELAQKYASLFVDPYVVIKVTNRRVFVFKGGTASVIPLNESPTSLIEVLARSGGLDRSLKAFKIKIIRGDVKNPEVHLVDLSTLEGLRTAELTMQPNDIVYVEDRKRIVRDAFLEAAPVFTAVTTVLSFILLIRTIGK